MIEDPDLTGDLLLVGIALARDVDRMDPKPDQRSSLTAVCEPYLGSDASWQVAHLVWKDRRRYAPDYSRTVRCGSPMIRRDGECGQRAKTMRQLVDFDTGEYHPVGACVRHLPWLRELWTDHVEERANREVPTPPANAGGILERHLPELDWTGLWKRLSKRYSPGGAEYVRPPESEPIRRPVLTMHVSPDDVDDETPAETPRRPVLRLVRDEDSTIAVLDR